MATTPSPLPHDPTRPPACSWRGLLIDSARTFWPVPVMELIITVMARYRLNILHWHLTDNAGWRHPTTRLPSTHLDRSPDSTRSRALVRPDVRTSAIGHMAYIARTHNAGFLFRRKHSTPRSLRRAARRAHHSGNLHPIPRRSRNPSLPTPGKPQPRLSPPGGQLNARGPSPHPSNFVEAAFHRACDLFPSPIIHIGGSPDRLEPVGTRPTARTDRPRLRDKTSSASSSTEPCASSTSMAGARPHGTRQSTPTAAYHLGQSSSPTPQRNRERGRRHVGRLMGTRRLRPANPQPPRSQPLVTPVPTHRAPAR